MPNATCCARRQLTRDGEGGAFYCGNCGASVATPRVSEAARYAGILHDDEMRQVAPIGSTASGTIEESA